MSSCCRQPGLHKGGMKKGRKKQISGLKGFTAPAHKDGGGKLFGTAREKAGMIPLGFVAALREGDPAARHGRVKQIPLLLAGC